MHVRRKGHFRNQQYNYIPVIISKTENVFESLKIHFYIFIKKILMYEVGAHIKRWQR